MTPTAIRTGRQFDSLTSAFSVPNATNTLIAPGDSNRVALVVSIGAIDPADLITTVLVGPIVGSAVVPLTTLTSGHPTCYLSVDKIGPALLQPIYILQSIGASLSVGVTIVRQVQELPK